MKALNVDRVDVCPWALREGIILHYLQTTFNQSFDLPLRPLTGSTYGKAGSGPAGGRRVALVAGIDQPGLTDEASAARSG